MKKIYILLLMYLLTVNTTFADVQKTEVKTGSIQENQVNSDLSDINLYLDFSKNTIPISSKRLIKDYEGYEVQIINKYSNPLIVLNAQIINGLSGQQAYSNVEKDVNTSMYWWGLTGYYITNKRNEEAKKECQKYTNQIPIGFITKGDTIKFNTIVPIGQIPQIKLLLQDTKNKELYTVVR